MDGPVEINGKVTGNIDVRTDIDISGNINFISGDISGVNNIYFSTGTGSTIQGVKDVYINNNLFVGTDISCAGQVMTNGNNLLYKTSAINWNSEGLIDPNKVKPLADIFLSTGDDLTHCVDGTFRLYAETRLNNELFTHELIFNSGLNSSSSNNFTQDISGINQALYIDLISSKCNSNQPLFKDLILKSRLVTLSSNTINSSLFVDTNSEVYGNLDIVELQVYNNNRNIPYNGNVPLNRFWNVNENLNTEKVVGFPRISIIKGDLEKYKYISFMPDISGNNPNIPYPNNSMGALNYDTVKFGNTGYVDSYNMNSYTIEPPSGWYTIAQLGPDFNYNLKQIADGIFYIDTSYFSVDGVTQGQSLIFRAGIYYNNDPYIDVISNNSYQGYNVTQIRIAYDCDNQQGGSGGNSCPTGGALVQILSTTNSSSTNKQYLNVKCYENKGNKGWNLNDISYNNWNNGSANTPTCYVDVEGFVDTNEYPDSRRPVLGSTYNKFLYSPVLTNGSNSSNKDMIYNGANIDISGGELSVSDGIIELINSEISGNPITLHVNGLNYEFSNTGLEMEEKIINNVSLIDGSINDICGNITIQANSLPIDGSNSTIVKFNSLIEFPHCDASNLVMSFNNLNDNKINYNDTSDVKSGVYAYDTSVNLLMYKPNKYTLSGYDNEAQFNDISYNTCPIYSTNPDVVTLYDYFGNYNNTGALSNSTGSPCGPDKGDGLLQGLLSICYKDRPLTMDANGNPIYPNIISSVNQRNQYPGINNFPQYAKLEDIGNVAGIGYKFKNDSFLMGMSFNVSELSGNSVNSLKSFAVIERKVSPAGLYDASDVAVLGLCVYVTPPIYPAYVTSPLLTDQSYNYFCIGPILCGPEAVNGVTYTEPGQTEFYVDEFPLKIPKGTSVVPFITQFYRNYQGGGGGGGDEIHICARNNILPDQKPLYGWNQTVGTGIGIDVSANYPSTFATFDLYIHRYMTVKKNTNPLHLEGFPNFTPSKQYIQTALCKTCNCNNCCC